MSETIIGLGPEQEAAPLVLKVRLPFPHRLNCFLRLWALKVLVPILYAIDRLIHAPPPSVRPTLIKKYPSRQHLQTRIFYPPTYSPSAKSPPGLPLYLNIHGGGFALGDPQQDDEWCTMWARRTNALVISLDYSKSPLHPFPTAVHDVAALAASVLSDPSLPIDKSRIAIGGFSAGGNLALCASQLPPLRGAIKAALTFYPIVNWDHPPEEKLRRRPYDPSTGPRDTLESSSYWFDWGYVSPGQNRRDPLLSPYHAKRGDLPPWIYTIAAEWDILRLETQVMMCELAGVEGDPERPVDFERGRYKWSMARGCTHGFTHHFGRREKDKKRREERCKPIYDEAVEWLGRALAAEEGQ